MNPQAWPKMIHFREKLHYVNKARLWWNEAWYHVFCSVPNICCWNSAFTSTSGVGNRYSQRGAAINNWVEEANGCFTFIKSCLRLAHASACARSHQSNRRFLFDCSFPKAYSNASWIAYVKNNSTIECWRLGSAKRSIHDNSIIKQPSDSIWIKWIRF